MAAVETPVESTKPVVEPPKASVGTGPQDRSGDGAPSSLLIGLFGFPLYWTITMSFKPLAEWNPPGKVYWWPDNPTLEQLQGRPRHPAARRVTFQHWRRLRQRPARWRRQR